jgi:ubiquinone biosynthesis protein
MASEQDRLGRIGSVLIKYGFEDAVKELLPLLARFRLRSLKPEIRSGSPYTRLRLALSELEPTFIKFGQFMRTRPDLLPPDLVKELKLLPDTVEPFPFNDVKTIIEKELGPARESIKSIEEKPFS